MASKSHFKFTGPRRDDRRQRLLLLFPIEFRARLHRSADIPALFAPPADFRPVPPFLAVVAKGLRLTSHALGSAGLARHCEDEQRHHHYQQYRYGSALINHRAANYRRASFEVCTVADQTLLTFHRLIRRKAFLSRTNARWRAAGGATAGLRSWGKGGRAGRDLTI